MILKGGCVLLIQATEAAIQQIKEELQDMKTDTKEPYIRLYMGLG